MEASDADEAITILEARKDIRIVFTDIDMPGSMDGLKLAHTIRERWPPIELILTSGHFDLRDDEIPERGRARHRRGLPRPVREDVAADRYLHLDALSPASGRRTQRGALE